MYSVVLLAAMTTSTADAPGFHKRSFGCTGGLFLHSGCYGSCMGFSGGCSGGGGYMGWGGGSGCSGCWGCMGCYGVYTGPVMTPAGNPMTAPPATNPPAPGSGTPKADTAKSAQVIIEKPADGKIYVDNLPVKSEGVSQTFSTPALDPAQAYYYMVRVEMTRDGKTVSESRKVIVRAGETIQATFSEQGIVTASLKP